MKKDEIGKIVYLDPALILHCAKGAKEKALVHCLFFNPKYKRRLCSIFINKQL